MNFNDRIILNQNNHTVKEIYQDFYAILAEVFHPRGYRYRKSKHDMYKKIDNFTISFNYQTYSWNCVGDCIEITIHKQISFDIDGEEHYFSVHQINAEQDIFAIDLKDISYENLIQLIEYADRYLTYMEEVVAKLMKLEDIGIYNFMLYDPYGKYEYIDNGFEKNFEFLNENGTYSTDYEEKNKHHWSEFYTKESIEQVYNSFYKYLRAHLKPSG